jgi:pyruvate ferredoxin oxidoreductase gamma subunit
LALAAIADGKSAQAFPSFGPERRGAPVIAFARVAEERIRNRTAIQKPNIVLVLDPSLLRLVPVDQGLQPSGTLVINSAKTAEDLRRELKFRARMVVVDANRVAREEIGRVITNTTMLGAMLAGVPVVPTDKIEAELERRFGRLAKKNIQALHRAQREAHVSEAV